MMGLGVYGCAQSVAGWAGEVVHWTPGSNDFNYNAGHFTALVWKGTTAVGCGMASCGPVSGQFVVCHFNPPGEDAHSSMPSRFAACACIVVGPCLAPGRVAPMPVDALLAGVT